MQTERANLALTIVILPSTPRRMKPQLMLLGAISALPLLTTAATIDRATLTEVVNNVSVIERTTKKTSTAKAQQIFEAPNVLRTGPDSRAEMISTDETVTRVGQNTLFSFQSDSREIDLQKGSILFQSPSGKGGGTIRTSAASAAVLGTTLIVSATSNGGFKVLLLEGKGRVTGKGGVRTLNAGQLVYALPGGALSNTFTFQLRQQAGASKLVRGFKRPLPSLAKIAAAATEQEKEIASGKVIPTGLLASGSPDYAYQVARETHTDSEPATATSVSPFAFAVANDAVISTPNLDSGRLFGSGLNKSEFASSQILFGGVTDSNEGPATNPALFLGNNITFDTSSVNLSRAAGRDLVQFFATSDINIDKSVDFSPYDGQLLISAGGTIHNARGVTVRASSPLLALLGFGHKNAVTDLPTDLSDIALEKTLTLERFNVANRSGALAIAGGKVELLGVQAAAANVMELNSSASLRIDRATGVPNIDLSKVLTEDGALPSGYSNFISNDSIRIGSEGDVSVRNASLRAPKILMFGENVTLERVRLNEGSTFDPDTIRSAMPGAATVRLKAQNNLNVSGVRFTANDVYMQARTISLSDMNFRNGSRIWLESALGVLADNPNTSAPTSPGKVNFVRNVRYGGTAITSPTDNVILQNGLPSSGGTPQGSGIVIRPRGR
jgi:hypothetical protein